MPRIIDRPTRIEAEGSPPNLISEFAGRVASGHAHVSVAHMRAPSDWHDRGKRAAFEEITVVLKGTLCVQYAGGKMEVREGQGIIIAPNEWVRYSTPQDEGAEYLAICVPAFSPEMANRDVA